MPRLVLCMAIAAAFFAVRAYRPAPNTPTPAAGVVAAVSAIATTMSATDRAAMGQAYEILARAVSGDVSADPVFARVGTIRQAHRAALEVVWAGVLGNNPDKDPGLSAALESALHDGIGDGDVICTDTIRTKASATLHSLSVSF